MSDNETMNEYNKQNFQAGALLTADQMSKIDAGLFNAFAKIKELEEKINSGNLGNGDSGTGSGNGSAITNIDEIKITILKNVYPIGSIYSSFDSTLPKDLFGFGSWEQIKGRFLIGTGTPVANTDGSSPGSYNYDAGDMGGEAEHVLTEAEMPEHTHYYLRYKNSGSAQVSNGSGVTVVKGEVSATAETHSIGSGEAHNNMPPYITVYMWQRVQDRFFITGQEYKVEEGMTWAEWCNKEEYNTIGYSITEEGYISNADDYIALNDEKVKSDSLIILDTNYSIIEDQTQPA